ncbi:hypothetical protein Tco_0344102 [Tanacetum coccineum]
MSNMSEDIWYAGSDTRPPMLDRTDFESWQQRIRLYCLGKDNGENIMKSITEGPFQMGTFIQTPAEDAEETEGALQLGPERARVFTDLSAIKGKLTKDETGNHNYTMNLNASVKSKERPFIFTILRNVTPRRPQSSDYFKRQDAADECSLKKCAYWMKSQLLILAGEQIHMDEYHEVHEMQSDVQHNSIVDFDADYTSDSNIIPYDQYVEDNEEHEFKRALFKEVKVMEEIFDQMNDEVDQNTVEQAMCLKLYLEADVEAPDFNSFFKIKNLEHQIQEKDNVIRDLKVLVSNVNDRSCEPYNANDVTDLLEQNERFRAEIEKVKQHYKELFESIKITRASTNEQTSSLLTQIEDLKAQLEGNLKVATRSSVKTKVLAPGMYAIDVKPISHPLKNNRSAHLTYINHLKESVENS